MTGVRLVRKSLGAIAAEGALDKEWRLTLAGGLEASVVYFRAGYTPDDYPDESCWAARELIEQSMAIKCPDITYHLVGTKKVQQILSVPGVLERFVDSEPALARLQQCFCRLYSLDSTDPDIRATVDRALRDPSSFVLKPQREGGGNNQYDDDLVAALRTLRPHDLEGFILMDMIRSPTVKACIMRNGNAVTADAIFELGIYGVVIGDGVRLVHNQFAGHLLRTKEAGSKEAGVAAGFGSIDSPYLV
jgi:glutathione synthetase